MKKKILFTTLALGAVALGVGSGVIALRSAPNAVKADTPVTISTLAQLKTYFDGAGTNCGNSATLAADIDLNGAYVSGMAGEFTATFNGNGHRLYNGKVGATTSLFNIIGTTGVVKNLTYDVTVTGAVVRPLSYLNNGTIQNSTAVIRTGAASVNNVAAYAYLAGSGTYTNLFTDWVVDHTGADWLCSIYRDQSSTKITDSYYTMNGKVASSADFQADGMTPSTDVNYVNSASAVSTTIGSTVNVAPEMFGKTSTSITYVSDNTSVATVATDGTVTGSAAGTANITCTVVSAKGTYTGITAVTVNASAPVSEIALTAAASSIYESKTTTVTATLTGTEYDHIAWTSSSDAIATVSGSGLSATVTGVAAGSATITATVYDSSSSVLASGTCAITVNESVYLDVYLLESKNTEGKTAFWDSAVVYPYGTIGDNSKSFPMTLVTDNSKSVYFRLANTTNSSTIDTYQLWKCSLNISGMTVDWTNAWVQFGHTSADRWGAGFQITSASGNIGMLGYKGSASPADSGWTTANLVSTLTYASGTIYGGSWRDSDSSICYKKNNQTTLKTLIDGYDALSTDVKAITNSLNDSTTSYTATYGETMVVLKSLYTSGNQANTIFSSDNKDNTALIAAIAGFSVVAVAAGTFILLRKKHE